MPSKVRLYKSKAGYFKLSDFQRFNYFPFSHIPLPGRSSDCSGGLVAVSGWGLMKIINEDHSLFLFCQTYQLWEHRMEQFLGAHPKLPSVGAAAPEHFQHCWHRNSLDVKLCPARSHWIPSEISTGWNRSLNLITNRHWNPRESQAEMEKILHLTVTEGDVYTGGFGFGSALESK